MKRIVFVALGVIASILAIGFIGILVVGYSFKKSLEPKIDPRLYREIAAKRIESSPNYRFLPPEVPTNASKVAFFHIPGFLQGGDVVILRVVIPQEGAKEILEELVRSGRKEITGFGEIPKPNAWPGFGMKKPGSKNMFEGVSELPADFRVFLFECDLAEIKNRWNHNFLAFTAVSLPRGEVVYYADSW